MRLTYKILWVDDAREFIDTSREDVEEYLDGLGYQLEVSKYYDGNDGMDHYLESNDWNLILMDFDLENNVEGTELIERIRGNNIYTEIIFYSSDITKLENSVQTEPLEGVYWAYRHDGFEEKVEKVIDITLKKALDINNVRGLVMAEVADMDHELTDIITLHHDNISEEQKSIFQIQMLERCKEQLERALEQIESDINGECTLDDCTNFRRTDSNKRFRAVKGILRDETIQLEDNQSNILNGYGPFLTKRNLLAHGKTERIDGEEVVVSNGRTFRLQETIELQRSILAHRKNFATIKQKIADHHSQ